MAKLTDEKREMKAQKFICGAKEEFKKFIPRDKIDDIGITECAEKDGVFQILGSVSTTSPTGKSKTFGYTAAVAVDGDGKAELSELKVKEV